MKLFHKVYHLQLIENELVSNHVSELVFKYSLVHTNFYITLYKWEKIQLIGVQGIMKTIVKI